MGRHTELISLFSRHTLRLSGNWEVSCKEPGQDLQYGALSPEFVPVYRRVLVTGSVMCATPGIFSLLGVYAGIGIMPNGDFIMGFVDFVNGLVGVVGALVIAIFLLWARSAITRDKVRMGPVVRARQVVTACSVIMIAAAPGLLVADIATSEHGRFVPIATGCVGLVGLFVRFVPRKIAIVAAQGVHDRNEWPANQPQPSPPPHQQNGPGYY